MNKHKIAWIALAVGIVVVLMLTWLVGVSPRLTHIKEADAQTAQIEESNKKTRDQIETLIFDEIDTGISGRTAQKVSEKMAVIGKHHQVLCITHLPQIAAMADIHFEIEKHQRGTETITEIHPLEGEDSVRELARLLGGAEITQAVYQNAKEMKELAQVHKNTRVK